MRKFRIALLSVLGLLFGMISYGQTIDQLKADIERAEEEIRLTTNLLEKTLKDKKANQSQLQLIQTRLKNRKAIVANLEKQIVLANKDIDQREANILSQEKSLKQLKDDYSAMVYNAYKNYKLNNFLVFIFSSKDFNDVTRRIYYMRRYNELREKKAEEIKAVSKRLEEEITNLDDKKRSLNLTKESKGKEVSLLSQDESTQKATLNKISTQESNISKQIRAKRREVEAAQRKIESIIAAENNKSKSKPRTEEEIRYLTSLSGKFDENYGKLPYPVKNGVIVEEFGTHPHPTEKGLTVKNTGVNIAANRGSTVYSVFEGEVSTIFVLPGRKNNILIKHGNYFTVYSNLEDVSVKPGQKVTFNQPIGRLSNNDGEDDGLIHFEIWKETQVLNPANWIRR